MNFPTRGAPKWFYPVIAASISVIALSIAAWAWQGTRDRWESIEAAVFNPRTGVRCYAVGGEDTAVIIHCRDWTRPGSETSPVAKLRDSAGQDSTADPVAAYLKKYGGPRPDSNVTNQPDLYDQYLKEKQQARDSARFRRKK